MVPDFTPMLQPWCSVVDDVHWRKKVKSFLRQGV